MSKNNAPNVIQAAGGLLWRKTSKGARIALVHRPGYNDWTLPKGKLKSREGWAQAALREVAEETACQLKLGAFAGCLSYTVNGGPKVVLYWHMQVTRRNKFRPNAEIDELVWLSPRKALKKLTYADERRLLKANFPK